MDLGLKDRAVLVTGGQEGDRTGLRGGHHSAQARPVTGAVIPKDDVAHRLI